MKFALILALLFVQVAEAKWSVSTFNIRNFDKDPGSGKTNLVELDAILKSTLSDVMAFEEIVNRKAFESLVQKSLPGYSAEISKCGGSGKQNLAIAYNTKTFEMVKKTEDLTFSEDANTCGSLRPVFLVSLRHKESKAIYTFGVVHLKAGGNERAFSQRWKQYSKLAYLSKARASENLILLGDFNSTGYNLQNEDFHKFEAFTADAGMKTTSDKIACTNFWTGTSGGYDYEPSILDHIVVQDKMSSSVESVKVGSHCAKVKCQPSTPEELGVAYKSVSDHCPVQVTFK